MRARSSTRHSALCAPSCALAPRARRSELSLRNPILMSIIKADLRSKTSDEWLNDLMICYTEKEIFRNISNEKIIKRFEEMKERRMLVPKENMVVCFILLFFDNLNSFK